MNTIISTIIIFGLAALLAITLITIAVKSNMEIDHIDINILGLFRFKINGKRHKSSSKKEKVASTTSLLPK